MTRLELLSSLRELASRGASVRELTDEIRNRIDYWGDSALPILWFFSEAFALPLPEVLPLREWFGSNADAEIDAVMLPRIAFNKDWWRLVVTDNAEHPRSCASDC